MTERNHTALVVDERQEILALMFRILGGEGFDVMVAENGGEALELARERPPEICLAHSTISDVNGRSVCRSFKEEAPLSNIPFLIILSKPSVHDIKKCFESGAADILTTPLHAPVVMARVRTQIRLHQCLSENDHARADNQAESQLSTEEDNENKKKENILVVDDDRNNRQLLSVILKKAGYQVEEAVDGRQALEKVAAIPVDLVLLDIMMPNMDGYEACRLLQENPLTSDIPVIFLSAKSETRDKIRGLEIGGADYVTKPFQKAEVIARVRSQLRIRSLTKDVIEKQKQLDNDLKVAAGIQQSLLPKSEVPMKSNLEWAWRFKPCDEIGGDIFNILPLDDTHYAIYILDVSGHGVPSALVTVSVSQMLQPHTNTLLRHDTGKESDQRIVAPVDVVKRLDHEYPMERFDKYFTLFYMLVDTERGLLKYCNAGHQPPFLFRADGTVETLDTGGPIVGLNSVLPFEEEELSLLPGDRIILYTDGVVEYEKDDLVFYGEKRFLAALKKSKEFRINTFLDTVMEDLTAFGEGVPPKDDITMLGVEYKGDNN